MLFNQTYELISPAMEPLSQEEIFNTPEFYALSLDEVLSSGRCPKHLKRVLLGLPWTGRPNYIQVRPQDFRATTPYILGDGWHVDANTALVNGRMHRAKSLDEFRSMVVSFGDVVETEFAKGPIEVPDAVGRELIAKDGDCSWLLKNVATERLAPNQVAVYTSRDIHRVSSHIRLSNMRLIIVTVELDSPLEPGAGNIRPSIREMGR